MEKNIEEDEFEGKIYFYSQNLSSSNQYFLIKIKENKNISEVNFCKELRNLIMRKIEW